MNKLQRIILFAALLFGSLNFVGAAAPASAQLFDGGKAEACKGANLDSSNATCANGSRDVQKTIQNIVNIIVIIVGIAAVVMIILNGLKLITSGGDANSISSARTAIIYALVGLVIAALAQVIVRFVINRIG